MSFDSIIGLPVTVCDGNRTSLRLVLHSKSKKHSHQVIDGTVIVNLNGTSQTYNFRYVSPVPEPTTLTLIGTGLLAAFWRKRSRVS